MSFYTRGQSLEDPIEAPGAGWTGLDTPFLCSYLSRPLPRNVLCSSPCTRPFGSNQQTLFHVQCLAGQDPGQKPDRGVGRRRDDADYLVGHQEEAHLAVPRRRPQVLRPRDRIQRRHGRQDHCRRGQRHQEVRCRREVCHHHSR